jgi:hypothetical protein
VARGKVREGRGQWKSVRLFMESASSGFILLLRLL